MKEKHRSFMPCYAIDEETQEPSIVFLLFVWIFG
ncbi:uncharacterized protein METZ01_LOCUS134483 [marine metagenome]|uniref:Uncharacterized protein n=1 Tax=marine metagenome TaxID=408172 RepID=A0A381YXD4_9ZZZZ